MTILEPAVGTERRSRRAALAGAVAVHAALLTAGLLALREPALSAQAFGSSVAVTLIAAAPGRGTPQDGGGASPESRLLQRLDADLPPGATEPASAAKPSSLSEVLDGAADRQAGGAAGGGAYGFDDPYAHVSLFGDKPAPAGQVVRNQVARCWRATPGLPSVILRVELTASGALRGEPKTIGPAKDASAAQAASLARQAVQACAPYPVPSGKPAPQTFDLRF